MIRVILIQIRKQPLFVVDEIMVEAIPELVVFLQVCWGLVLTCDDGCVSGSGHGRSCCDRGHRDHDDVRDRDHHDHVRDDDVRGHVRDDGDIANDRDGDGGDRASDHDRDDDAHANSQVDSMQPSPQKNHSKK